MLARVDDLDRLADRLGRHRRHDYHVAVEFAPEAAADPRLMGDETQLGPSAVYRARP